MLRPRKHTQFLSQIETRCIPFLWLWLNIFKKCTVLAAAFAVYLLDSAPVRDEAVGVQERKRETTCSRFGRCCLNLQKNAPMGRPPHTDAARQINIHIQGVCAWWKHGELRNDVCVNFGSVCFLSQQLSTYQAAVIPNLPLYLTSSLLPSLRSLSCMALPLFSCVF